MGAWVPAFLWRALRMLRARCHLAVTRHRALSDVVRALSRGAAPSRLGSRAAPKPPFTVEAAAYSPATTGARQQPAISALRLTGSGYPIPLVECGSGALQALREVGVQLVERDALLRHGVAVAHRDGAVVERVEVDRDAERRADLVLTTVAAADRAGVVEVDRSSEPRRVSATSRASGDSCSLRDSGSTATLTGARRGSSLSTVRVSVPPLAFGTSSSRTRRRGTPSSRG